SPARRSSDLTWSTAALAADAADDEPRAWMTAAPRCWTVGMNSPSSHAWSPIVAATLVPPTSAWKASGYWVAEWLPQMVMRVTSATGTPSLAATWALARLWSRRGMAVNRRGSMPGALRWAMGQLGLAGLPTTRIRTSSPAAASRALPWAVKMAPLADSRSERAIPAVRGREPTRRA